MTLRVIPPRINVSELSIGDIKVALGLSQKDFLILTLEHNDCWTDPPLDSLIKSQLELRVVPRNEQLSVNRSKQSVSEAAADIPYVYLKGQKLGN